MDLVGVGADEACLHRVDRAVERFRSVDAEVAERLAHGGKQPVAEGAAAGELVLEEPGLAFVNAHGGVGARREQRLGGVGVLGIDRVAGLVDGGEQALAGVGVVDAGGDADVAAGAVRGGMDGEVEPSGVPVVAEDAGHAAGEVELPVGREAAGEDRRRARGVGDPGAERGQTGAEPGEERLEVGGGGAGLEVVEKRVVAVASGSGEAVGLGALQRHHAFEVWREALDIIGFPGAAQAVCAATAAAARSAARLPGTFTARPCSRAASARLTVPAASCGAAAAIQSAMRGSAARACIASATAAACSPRWAAPFGGIWVSWSQFRRPATCSSAAIRRRCWLSWL